MTPSRTGEAALKLSQYTGGTCSSLGTYWALFEPPAPFGTSAWPLEYNAQKMSKVNSVCSLLYILSDHQSTNARFIDRKPVSHTLEPTFHCYTCQTSVGSGSGDDVGSLNTYAHIHVI